MVSSAWADDDISGEGYSGSTWLGVMHDAWLAVGRLNGVSKFADGAAASG
jgi:hypothetical protein